MAHPLTGHISAILSQLAAEGLLKNEHEITSPQSGQVQIEARRMINLCANNYLGLADHAKLMQSEITAWKTTGFGMASARFICGTQDLHRQLERRLASFLGKDDSLFFVAGFDANTGLLSHCLDPKMPSFRMH